jgi:hypothetical protein
MSELLELEALRRLPDDVMTAEDPCLYFLWKGDELLYIGGTTQCCERISRHIRDRNYKSAQNGRPVPFDRYTFLHVPDRFELWKLETEYQTRYDPPYNTVSYRRRMY